MAYKQFVAGEEALASDVNSYLMSQTVARFASASARSAAITAPVLNQLSQLDTNPGEIDYWNGAAWTPVPPAETLVQFTPNVAANASTSTTFETPALTLPAGAWTVDLTVPYQGSAAVANPFQQVTLKLVASSTGHTPGSAPTATQLTAASGTTALNATNLRVMGNYGRQTATTTAKVRVQADVGGGNTGIIFNGLVFGSVRVTP